MEFVITIIALAVLALPEISEAKHFDQDQVCGPRCVQHILAYYGIQVELVDLVEEIQQSSVSRGSTATELRDALQQRGISCHIHRLGIFEVPKSDQPAILHVNNNHFVVFEGWDGSEALVWDGLRGVKKLSWWKFCTTSSRVILLTSNKPIAYVHSHIYDFRPMALKIGIVLIVIGGIFLSQRLIRRFWYRLPVKKYN